MSKLSFSKHVLYMAMIMALIASFSGLGPVSAQPTQALIEDWRASDFNYASSMMDTDQSDNVYVVGDTATSRNLIIKKFDGAGTLLWQTPYDAVDALSGVWIAVDGNGSAVVQANRGRNFDGYSSYSNIATIITSGGICPDFNHNGVVDVADLSAIASLWGQPAPADYDLDGDGFVTIADIEIVAALWGTSCP
ncbi:hypothetical protein [Candidatus Amarolinea dominans]|uniref:hypothetical protein n=1 Tax=Candidatus Amarolinea dominans TaxID=3140696 RepID=UPI001DA05B38|nr:hypothetical protein [Anaerolineae bacterium]